MFYVLKNERLYDGNTCNQIYPVKRNYTKEEWKDEKPFSNKGVSE